MNGSESPFWDSFWWDISSTHTWALVLVSLFWLIFHRESWRLTCILLLCIALCILLADQISSSLIKPFVQRFRPTHDPEIGNLVDTVNGYVGGRYGFVSSHAANMFSLAVFLCMLIRRHLLCFTVLVHALLVSYSRIYLGVHFPGDIIGGALLGSLIGVGVYWLYLRLITIKKEPGGQQVATGFSLVRIRLFIASFYVTYFLVFLKAFFN